MYTPILQTIPAFDATQSHIFYFTTPDTITSSALSLYINEYKITTITNSSSDKFVTMDANTLANGDRYTCTIQTYNSSSNSFSAESVPMPFYCYTTPTFTIDVIGGSTLSTSNHKFSLTYSQIEGEKLSYANFKLYDSNNNLLQSSGNISGTSALEYTFSGLSNGSSYKIEGNGLTVQNTSITTGKISFNVFYYSPDTNGVIALSTDCTNGSIKITSKMSIIDGVSNPYPPTYPNHHSIDLTASNAYVDWNNGFEINTSKDWTLQLYCKNIENEETICSLFNSEPNYLSIDRLGDYLQVQYYVDGNVEYLNSNTLSSPYNASTEYAICLMKTGNLFGLYWQPITPSFSVDIPYNTFPICNQPNFTRVRIEKAVFGQIDICQAQVKFVSDYPTWRDSTILNCDFFDNIYGGSLKYPLSQVNSITIKRREVKDSGSTSYIQILPPIEIDSQGDINFIVYDYLCGSNHEYEYAIVPKINNLDINYLISDTITPIFDGVFVSDMNSSYKLYYGMAYGGTTDNKDVGIVKPIGRKYPIVISNSKIRYKNGSVSGTLLGYNYETTRAINRGSVVAQTNDFLEFLNNGNPKTIKDWNGNIWLAMVSDSPSVSYDSNYGMGTATTNFNWIEQGDVNKEDDLINNGLI